MQRLNTRLTLIVWAVVLAAAAARVVARPGGNGVYTGFALAGQSWLAGEDLYFDADGVPKAEVFRYAPAVAVAFAPFSLLPVEAGGVLWRALNVAVFLAGLAVWCRWSGGRARFAWVGLLVLPLAYGSVANGQCNALVAGLLLLSAVAFDRDRLWLAAAAIALTALFKVYPIALGLLFVLAAPRRFGPRLAVCLAVGLGLPYLLHPPEYVSQMYRQFYRHLAYDDRTGLGFGNAYTDLHRLLMAVGVHLSLREYRLLEAVLAAGCALALGVGVWMGRGRRWQAEVALGLGLCWMTLAGPATEPCTYILLAPLLARAVCEPPGRPSGQRALAFGSYALFTVAIVAFWFPKPVYSAVNSLGVMPLAALLLTAHTLRDRFRPWRPEPVAPREAPPRAA
jgi:hypothetical protein